MTFHQVLTKQENFLENIIKAAGEGGTLNEIVKTASEGGSLGDIINVATDNESVGELIKKVATKKQNGDEDVEEEYVEEEEVVEEEVEEEEVCSDSAEEEEECEEETEEETSNKGLGSVLGGVLKNVDLGNIAKAVIGIIGLAGVAMKKNA